MPGKIIDTLAAAAPLPPRPHCVLRLAIVRTFDCALQPIHAALGEWTMLGSLVEFLNFYIETSGKVQNSESATMSTLHKFRQEIHPAITNNHL